VEERKNRTMQEMTRTMLNDSKVFDIFWKEEVHNSFHILNRGLLTTNSDKTPYELWKGRLATVNYFIVFGRKCYIKLNEENLGNFGKIQLQKLVVETQEKRETKKRDQ
jgi:hypothetical protein